MHCVCCARCVWRVNLLEGNGVVYCFVVRFTRALIIFFCSLLLFSIFFVHSYIYILSSHQIGMHETDDRFYSSTQNITTTARKLYVCFRILPSTERISPCVYNENGVSKSKREKRGTSRSDESPRGLGNVFPFSVSAFLTHYIYVHDDDEKKTCIYTFVFTLNLYNNP